MPDALGSDPIEDLRCTRELVRLVTLPQAWTGRDPGGVAEVLLDEIVPLFRAEVAWVRLVDGRGTRTEQARSGWASAPLDRARELGRRMDDLPGGATELCTLDGVSGLRPGTWLRLASAPIGDGVEGGLLVIGSDRSDFPTGSERLLLRVAAGLALLGLRSALQVEQVAQAARDRALLDRIADGLHRATRLEDVFGPALDGIQHALGTERSAILLLGDSGALRFVAWRGLSDDYLRAFDGEHSPWQADRDPRSPILCVDIEACPELGPYRSAFRDEGIGSVACLPLVYGERLLGKLMVCFDAPHRFDGREVQLAGTIASDVAQAVGRRQAERENASLVADLQRNLHFSELFVAVLGHDLRNPLFAIKAAAWLISRRVPPDPLTDVAHRITDSANRMSRMIDQILDFTRLRLGGEIPLTCEPVDLYEIVRGVADELHTTDGTRDLALSTLGDTRGEWDRDRLAQLLSNLLGNAFQHATPGTRIELVLDGTGPGGVTIEIRSHGEIDRERLHHLFEPLRARTCRRSVGSSGLGLGLYICRQIALAHGGSIRAEADAGSTRFHVHLPRRPPAPEDHAG